MFWNVSSVILYVLLALTVVVVPGLALLRVSVPFGSLRFLCRVAIAPGISIAINVLVFTWCDLCHLKPGPILPWFLIVGSALVLILVRPTRANRAQRLIDPIGNWNRVVRRIRRAPLSEWLAAVALTLILAVFLVIRFRAIWGWFVPPGMDSEQHTMIVQLLIEHRGLFQSWAPYSDAETFTYHFGFHAVTAVFAWISGLDGIGSVFIMSRVIGATAAAALFALVRIWTRSAWGGVFAVAFCELYSAFLFPYEMMGRWTLLAGLTASASGLVLLSIWLRPGRIFQAVPVGLACAITAGGIVLTQYKSAITFSVLAGILFLSRCLPHVFGDHTNRVRRVFRITCRLLIVAGLALLVTAPRLNTVMQASAGHYLKHIVVDAPPATAVKFDKPTLDGMGMLRAGFETRRKGLVSAMALIAVAIIGRWRRRALWFVVGWIVLTLMMNPTFVGSSRLGVIDEMHWKLAFDWAVAAMAGLAIGVISEPLRNTRSIVWNAVPFVAVTLLIMRAATGLEGVPAFCRYVLADDVRLMKWIEQNVPSADLIAGRGYLEHGEILGRDAMMWLPQFTRHRTNHTTLAAGLEKGPVELRRKLREFTAGLYARDMSTVESAAWMREQGFRWFYAGAILPGVDGQLLDQLARNPELEVAQQDGAARLYRAR